MEVEPSLQDRVTRTLEQLKAGLDAPYPAEVGEPEVYTPFEASTNSFRPGPCRKVFVFDQDGVDFQYDEDAREGDDLDLMSANDTVFDYVLPRLQALLGPPLGHHPIRWDCVMHPISDEDNQNAPGREEVEGENDEGDADSSAYPEWTPEYDQGTLIDADDINTRYWVVNGQNVFLQGGYIAGDDNLACFVVVTVTPVVGRACLEGYWPAD
jgi:hypothetical protein